MDRARSVRCLAQHHSHANIRSTPLISSAEGSRICRRRDAHQRLQPRGDAQRVQKVRLRHRPMAGGVRAALRHRLPGR